MNLSARMVGASAPTLESRQTPLADLPLGTPATITGLDADVDASTARRLFDLGFCAGTSVTALRRTPLGGPRIYRVGDYDLALRAAQARCILVSVA